MKNSLAFSLMCLLAAGCSTESSTAKNGGGGQEVQWGSDFQAALDQAGREGKPVLVDFMADWCGWCKELDRTTYRDPEVVKLSEKFVTVKVNTDHHPALGAKYASQGLPTIVVLDSKGGEVRTQVGFSEAEPFAKFLRYSLDDLAAKSK